MKTREEIKEMVGAVKEERIVAGKYGNAYFTENGFVIADPCYVLGDEDYAALRKARYASPEKDYKVWRSAWHELELLGEKVWVRDTGGDGCFFGCSVDSGWVIVMPEKLYKKAEVVA